MYHYSTIKGWCNWMQNVKGRVGFPGRWLGTSPDSTKKSRLSSRRTLCATVSSDTHVTHTRSTFSPLSSSSARSGPNRSSMRQRPQFYVPWPLPSIPAGAHRNPLSNSSSPCDLYYALQNSISSSMLLRVTRLGNPNCEEFALASVTFSMRHFGGLTYILQSL